jgi:hypothetical protein
VSVVPLRVGGIQGQIVPIYFFNILHCGQLIPDDEGLYLPDMEAARIEARHTANDLVAGDIVIGKSVSADVVQITTVAGEVVEALPVRDVFH